MAVRYIPSSDFVCADRQGRRRMFKTRHIRGDGTVGYLADELKGLSRDQLTRFRELSVSGEGVVEQATAAPGEKRATRAAKANADS